jgi:hypothetical protein
MLALALLLLSHVAPELAAREAVDSLEVNHFYDEQGHPVFDQAIFYQWNRYESRFDVVAWRLVKSPSQLPVQDFRAGGFVTVWQDGDKLREVRAQSSRETWLQFDPELTAREDLPKERRKELR